MEPDITITKKQRMVVIVEQNEDGKTEIERYGDNLWKPLKIAFIDELRSQIESSKEDLV